MNWLITCYKSLLGCLLLVFVTAQLATTAQAPPADKIGGPVITGNSAVDETFAGIERASGWTDRALMLGMLVLVLLMCGYFLKTANDEAKRQRVFSAEATKQFADKITDLTKDMNEISHETVKQVTLSNNTLQEYLRSSEQNRALVERVLRVLEKVEKEFPK